MSCFCSNQSIQNNFINLRVSTVINHTIFCIITAYILYSYLFFMTPIVSFFCQIILNKTSCHMHNCFIEVWQFIDACEQFMKIWSNIFLKPLSVKSDNGNGANSHSRWFFISFLLMICNEIFWNYNNGFELLFFRSPLWSMKQHLLDTNFIFTLPKF